MEKPSLQSVPGPNGDPDSRRGEAAKPLMAGKRGLVMGVANDRSIAWGIAKALHAQGAEVAFSYQGEAFQKRVMPLAQSLGADFMRPCDADKPADLEALFKGLGDHWGRLDFVVHAIAFSDKDQLTTSPERWRSPVTPSRRSRARRRR
jgi:enoyl-[acyl-carrier-protein] reductase (NADH)